MTADQPHIFRQAKFKVQESLINIAFVMNGAKPPRGGEYLTLYLITHLRRDIFRPILIYAEDGVIVNEIKKAGIVSAHLPLNKNITGIYPREIKLYNPFFICRFIWHMLTGRNFHRLKRILMEHNIQIIYCADNLSKFLGGVTGKMTGIKVVAHCHDDFKEDSLGKIMRAFYLLLLDRILAVSEKVRSFFKVRGKISARAVTVYNGIDAERYNPSLIDDVVRKELGFNDRAFIIGSIGVLERDKGQKYLFEAIAKLKSGGFSDVRCIVCGVGPEEENLKKTVREMGIEPEVLFLGFRSDIPGVLRMLDALVITSLTIESFSMVAAEAMSMKVPVIATNIGGLPEVVDDGKTGVLIPPADPGAISDALEKLIKNPAMRIEMGENGRNRVLGKFTIDENVRRTEEIFLDMHGRSN